ncbi:hypothetical protein A6R68_06412, partial [Neotoma lepida]
DWAGKTFLLHCPTFKQLVQNVSTQGFKTEFGVPLEGSLGITYQVCDVGGPEKLRPLRHSYTHQTDCGGVLVPVLVLVLVLVPLPVPNKQDLVEKMPSTQELAAAVLTHVQGCRPLGGLEPQPDLEHLCEMMPGAM